MENRFVYCVLFKGKIIKMFSSKEKAQKWKNDNYGDFIEVWALDVTDDDEQNGIEAEEEWEEIREELE